MESVHASRELLFPGPQPPLSHFGVTLLRHVVLTGLRYSLYQLGLPAPERAPVRIIALRLYLDVDTLRNTLAPGSPATPAAPSTAPALEGGPGSGARRRGEAAHGEPGSGAAVLGALAEPGGAETGAPGASSDERHLSRRLRGAAAFHRLRLLLARPPRHHRPPATDEPSFPEDLWRGFRQEITRTLPALNDAFLAEVVAALERRRARGRGREAAPCLGRESWRLRAGRRARLACLGDPDPLVPSWAAEPGRAARAAERLAAEPLPPRHRLRGRFRERCRAALDGLAARYRLLAADAARRGLLDDPEDAFFLPFDLAEDLAAERRPSWLAAAVAANRREHRSLLAAACPPAAIGPRATGLPEVSPDWTLAPLHPLP